MRNRIVFVALVTVLAAAFILWRQKRSASAEPDEITSRVAQRTERPVPVAHPAPPTHVRKMAPADRQKLADQIHASLARRSPSNGERANESTTPPGSAGSNPFPDEPLLELKDIGPELKSALDESIPILADCYEQHPGNTVAGSGSEKARTALALMVMTTDPDLGTIVDSDKLTDADGTPLAPAIEGCLRDTIGSLALPPLGKPGKLPLQYSFRFDDK